MLPDPLHELNRLEKEQGKKSGGSKDKALNFVRNKIRKETGRPAGQRKKVKGVKDTSAAGKLEGTFAIPDSRFPGQENNPRFRTGEVAFRVTSSETNDRSVAPKTFADAIYFAKGTLEVEQETIIATRNGILVQENVTDNRTLTKMTEPNNPRDEMIFAIKIIWQIKNKWIGHMVYSFGLSS